MWFGLALLAAILTAVVVGLLTRKPPYQCPPGTSIAATVKRHGDAGPLLVTLVAAGIDAQVVEETAKSFWRRLPGLLYAVYRGPEPQGPWHVLVPTADLAAARRLLDRGEADDSDEAGVPA